MVLIHLNFNHIAEGFLSKSTYLDYLAGNAGFYAFFSDFRRLRQNKKQLTFVVKSSIINPVAMVQEGAMGNITIRGEQNCRRSNKSYRFFHTRFLAKYTHWVSSPFPA